MTTIGKEKVSPLIPMLTLIAKQNGLRLNRPKEFKKAKRIFVRSLTFN